MRGDKEGMVQGQGEEGEMEAKMKAFELSTEAQVRVVGRPLP